MLGIYPTHRKLRIRTQPKYRDSTGSASLAATMGIQIIYFTFNSTAHDRTIQGTTISEPEPWLTPLRLR